MRLPLWLSVLALLQAGAPREVELFDGESLAGWRAVGDARYSADDGSILGEIGGGGQSFLVTEREFGDFVLEVDVKTELPGNSGIQIRSHQREDGRVFGYQVEIDPSERAWSGGLYDEARRGWLQNLEGRDEARAAFRPGEWNAYRIECRGPWIRTWINGVPITDCVDPLDMTGFIGLQVHSGDDTRVRWRAPTLVDHGHHEWRPAPDDLTASTGRALAVRWAVAPGAEPAVLRIGRLTDSEDLVAPGVLASAVGWRVWLAADATIDLSERKARAVAVIWQGELVHVFLDGRELGAVPGLAGGPVHLAAPGLEVLEAVAR